MRNLYNNWKIYEKNKKILNNLKLLKILLILYNYKIYFDINNYNI